MKILAQAGISQAELCRRLGLHQNTVSKWRGCPPQYAMAYIDLLIAHNNMRDIIGEAIR